MPPAERRPAVALIINPIAGRRGGQDLSRRRAELAANAVAGQPVEPLILMSEYPGHARALTLEALARGATRIIAWGGDGTVNEVASMVVHTPAALAIVPGGSGNGLARELAIPLDVRAALRVALGGQERVMDAGQFDGRLFFNVAGVGLDARVAHRFAAGGVSRRGLRGYVTATTREWFASTPDQHTVVVDGVAAREPTLIIAVANSRQYGNGVLIAPEAKIDDGLLNVVSVAFRRALSGLLQVPQAFASGITRLPAVTMRLGRLIELESSAPIVYHVDGEPFVGDRRVSARVIPGALRVVVPNGG